MQNIGSSRIKGGRERQRFSNGFRSITVSLFCVCPSVCVSAHLLFREDFLSQRKWTARRMTRLRLPPWLHLAAMNSTPQELVTSTLFNHNTSICITYGVWVLMRSWYHIWDFFLCKSSSIRRNYGTLSLALENLQWTNRYHQTSF